jgi:acyl-CoA synthetase (AMP-forming)/AMP-acid ligase II
MTVSTLPQLLQHAATNSADKGVSLYAPGNLEAPAVFLSYSDLLQRAQAKAEQLKTLGVQANKPLLIHFKRQVDSLEWFWACTLVGAIPVMSTPFSNNADQRRSHILYLNSLLENPICLTKNDLLSEFAGQAVLNVVLVETLPAGAAPSTSIVSKSADDIAALMLTSGSTGNAKAVVLTHGMVLAAVEAKSAKNDTSAETVFFNWIGFDHVASLTEVHLHAMFTGSNQIHAEAADLVQDPLSFLVLLDRHQIGYTFGPNFFVAAVLRTLQDFPEVSYSLSSLKHLISGGEANVVETSAKAAAAFAKFGAAANVIKPAFGMTETCAGSIYNMDFPARDEARGNEFSSLGTTHKGMEMRIVNENGDEVPAGTSGSLEVRGPVVFSQYYRNPEATKNSFHDGWFVTGDNGKIEADGQLDLTGRTKEILIINGINYTPHEVEATLEDVEGAKPSFTAVFAYRSKGSETESIAVVYAPTYEVDK